MSGLWCLNFRKIPGKAPGIIDFIGQWMIILKITKESIIDWASLSKNLPHPSLPKRGFPSL
jgi:hypothetical protein